MAHCCFQTYPQPTVLTELAHMGHLKQEKSSQFLIFFHLFSSPVCILCSLPKRSSFLQKLQNPYRKVANV